jgi:hypothetical protein
MKTLTKRVMVILVAALLSSVACGSSDDGASPGGFGACCASGSACGSGVCHPDHKACTVKCTTDADCPAEPKNGDADCKDGLCQAESEGDVCAKGSSSTVANRGDYCAKCAACVSTPGFSEGFCDPFRTAGGFDSASCNSQGDLSQVANTSYTAAQISAMSCAQFDDSI